MGEKTVTPGSIVSLTIKLRMTPPGRVMEAIPVKAVAPGDENIEGEETSIDEIIGRRSKSEDGDEPTPLAHAPYFPKVRLTAPSKSRPN